MSGRPSMKNGDLYSTKSYGDVIVVDYKNAKEVTIVFLNTGYSYSAEAADVRKGNLKDPLQPSVCGVGILGVGPHKVSVGRKATREYNIWQHMIKRCYDPRYQKLKPTYVGCTVDDRWKVFQNFCEDLPKIDGYPLFQSGQPCHLDKDLKFLGNKVYSLKTCTFITPSENSEEVFTRGKR